MQSSSNHNRAMSANDSLSQLDTFCAPDNEMAQRQQALLEQRLQRLEIGSSNHNEDPVYHRDQSAVPQHPTLEASDVMMTDEDEDMSYRDEDDHSSANIESLHADRPRGSDSSIAACPVRIHFDFRRHGPGECPFREQLGSHPKGQCQDPMCYYLSGQINAERLSMMVAEVFDESPRYTPTLPQYSPVSPVRPTEYPARYQSTAMRDIEYAPMSPQYNPTSPQYSPTSPQYSPTSPQSSATSPRYCPTSPNPYAADYQYAPTSPQYVAGSPQYDQESPPYSPISPVHAAEFPRYDPLDPSPDVVEGRLMHSSRPRTDSPGYYPTKPSYEPYETRSDYWGGPQPAECANIRFPPAALDLGVPILPSGNGHTGDNRSADPSNGASIQSASNSEVLGDAFDAMDEC